MIKDARARAQEQGDARKVLADGLQPQKAPAIVVSDSGILLTRPTIKLVDHIMLTIGDRLVQTDKLEPELAMIAHGAIVIREYNLVLPLVGAVIRSR